MEHPADSLVSSYVLGMLAPEEHDAFVAHVSSCEACAARVQAEAELELRVLEVHDEERRRRAPREAERGVTKAAPLARGRIIVGAFTAIALAAAVLLFLRTREHEATERAARLQMTVTAPAATAPIPLVTCPDGRGQAACIEQAHRRGLYVVYPPAAGAPRLSGSSGPSSSPFGDHGM